MAKYLKTALLIIAYTIIYFFVTLFCQIVLGLTIGGAGGELIRLISGGSPASQPQIQEAANAAASQIAAYARRNTGIMIAISALLSLLAYIRIFSARKMNLFSVLRMDCKPSGADVKNGVFAGISANFVITFLIVMLYNIDLFKEAFSKYNALMETAFGFGGVFQNLIGMGLVASLVEEILFRGMIKSELERVSSWKTAIIIQGVLFGLYHMTPVQIFYTIPLGIYLGYITHKTGSVWPAAAGHVALNSASVLLTAPGISEIFSVPQFALFIMVLSFYLFASSFRYFIKRIPEPASRDRPAPGG